jgi:hypothetical protein
MENPLFYKEKSSNFSRIATKKRKTAASLPACLGLMHCQPVPKDDRPARNSTKLKRESNFNIARTYRSRRD